MHCQGLLSVQINKRAHTHTHTHTHRERAYIFEGERDEIKELLHGGHYRACEDGFTQTQPYPRLPFPDPPLEGAPSDQQVTSDATAHAYTNTLTHTHTHSILPMWLLISFMHKIGRAHV